MLREEARDYLRELMRRAAHEVPLSELSEDEEEEEEEEQEEEKEKKTNGDEMSKIISGTPQELVSNGSISRFAKGA